MITRVAILCFSIFFLAQAAKDKTTKDKTTYNGTFLILAPRTIRPALPYSVSVNIFDNSPPVVVDLTILDDQNRSIAHSQGLSGRDFKPGQAQTVSFDTLPTTVTAEAKYRLHITGKHSQSGKILFDQQQDLSAEAKSRSTFIQTDKAIYKPGALVHFRVVVITPDLKPYKGKADIKVSDPNENVIKQFLAQSFDGGVLGKNDKLTIQLSDEPPLGDWKITVDVDGQKTEKTFTVDKYVLPKFDVSVQTPPYIPLRGDVEVNVTAKYTYGKGVVGKLALVSEIQSWYYPSPPWVPDSTPPPPPPRRIFTKTVDLDKSGITTVRITRAELDEHKLTVPETSWSSQYNIDFTAAVTEKFSGTQRNATGSVTAYKNIYKVETKKQVDTFKPGLDYNISITVVTQDGKPLPPKEDRTIYLQINYQVLLPPIETTTTTTTTTTSAPNTTTQVSFPEYYYPPLTTDVQENKAVKLGADGTYTLTLNPPLNATNLRLEVHYGKNDSEVSSYESAEASKSPTDSYIQLLTKTPSVTAGDKVTFSVRSTAPLTSITVQVLSKGYIVLSNQVKLSGQNGEISFPSTSDMAPKSRVIAYAIRQDNKEILVDAMDFHVAGMQQNNVSISVKPIRVEPNQTVTFSVKAAPSSYIGLLAVDQSVLLLKSGNDITSDMVEGDIASYGSGGYSTPWGPFARRKRMVWCRWCWWSIGGVDATTVFENSGVLVFTDAYLYKQPPPPRMEFMKRRGGSGKGAGGGGGGGRAAPVDVDSLSNAQPTEISAKQEPEKPESSEPTIRTKFPETWIWADIVSHADGTTTYQATAPDTITSWITSAFAISDSAGLGVAPEPVKLEVFRPFFIRMDLPYSVKRGEKLALPIIAFNYLDTDQKVTVTLDHNGNSSGFDFVEKPGSGKQSNKQWNVRTLNVPGSGGSAAAYFPIVANTVGEIKLLVKAIGDTGSDAVEMPLIVEPEGFPVYKTSPFILELSKATNKLSKTIQLDIPKDAVPGSPKAEFTVNGDIMASVLNNIDQLVQMPYGCGEQNMVTFVPDIAVTQYLKTTQRLTPTLEERAKKYMEAGYQRELTYKRDDNSYSAFGKSDTNGSTWLTAFVVRSLKQAKPFIFIDDAVLKAGLNFLKTQQKENGVFEEHGMIHHKAMQGGASQGGVGLTAYVLLAFLSNDSPNNDALNFLERSLDRIANDSYSLSIVTYALHLAKSAKKDQAWKYLQSQAIEQDGQKHWTYTVRDDQESKNPSWWEAPRPVDVEATAYALHTYVLRNEISGALPIVRWLASKRNAYGGYSSTQDTVVALQALSAYAANTYSKDTDFSVTVTNGDIKQTFKVDTTNSIVLQSTLMKNLDKPIQIDSTGQGIAYAQINYHYNMPKRNDPQPFVCTKTVSETSNFWGGGGLVIGLCCHYALTGHSNMVVVEANALSGYTIEEYELNKLTAIKDLQRVELDKGNTKANIYINSLNATDLCFNITADRSFQVAEQKPALIVVYDYYDPGRRIEFDYGTSKPLTLQDVCGDDCWPDSATGAAAGTSTPHPTVTANSKTNH